MKALIDATGGEYSNTHSISDLLGAVRHFDHEMREFSLSVPPDVYTEYEGQAECRARRQPELTQYPDYLERTKEDVSQIINRAKELRDRAMTDHPDREIRLRRARAVRVNSLSDRSRKFPS